MSLHWKILTQLADGNLHSGQKMAAQFGVTRSAIWKALKKLEEFDLLVDHQRGVGYRLLAGPLDLLTTDEILSDCGSITAAKLGGLHLLREIPSTNQYLLDNRIRDAGAPMACFAEYQSAGRGRRGRSWHSPLGTNLYSSLAWPVRAAATDLAGLSLAVGVTVADVLSGLGVQRIGLKWPNDLLVDGQKLGGILIDLRGEANGVIWVVIGIGINVNMQSVADRVIDQPWISCLQLLGEPLSRNRLAGRLIEQLITAMEIFEKEGFSAFSQRWSSRDLLVGESIWVDMGGKKVTAVAKGVDATGALLVEYEGSTLALHSGEVTVRVAD